MRNAKTQKLINRLVRSKVNFLSGTMSPAKSDPETMDIESFEHAMEHYAKRGVKSVIVQPKYMGSRCQLYLFADIEKCYATSRNGFKINHVDLTEVFKFHWDKLNDADFWVKFSSIILDGELMPWRVLGEGLIDKTFYGYADQAQKELEDIRNLGIQFQVNSSDIDFGDIEDELRDVKLFRKQVDLFGQEGETKFLPFNTLKLVSKNGKEDVMMDKNHLNTLWLSECDMFEGRFAVVDPSNYQDDVYLATLMSWVISEDLEGVVVKPSEYKYQEDRENRYAPYLKVRNPEYLRIVYGADYQTPQKLETLVKKKSIGRKLGMSIKEYEIGRKLLQIPTGMVDSNNEEYKNLIEQAVMCIEKEQELDPRL